MPKLSIRSVATAALMVTAIGGVGTASAETTPGQTYQIVRATDSQVWRLNTRTGEVAVCSLQGEQLLCTSSAQAITPPAKTYAQLESEREAQAELEAQRREEKRKRGLAMLTLMLNAFKDLAVTGSRTLDAD